MVMVMMVLGDNAIRSIFFFLPAQRHLPARGLYGTSVFGSWIHFRRLPLARSNEVDTDELSIR